MIKFLHSGMVGAPQINNAADAVIAALDAALVNGFNERTASAVAVSGGVATVTLPSGHGFEIDSVVRVSGATPGGLNGDKRVLSTAATTITFSAVGIPDGAATGTILVRYAPLDWIKPFTGTNAASYRSTDASSTQMFLNITGDAASTGSVTAIGFESMTSAAVGTGAFPASGTRLWPKASSTGAAPWLVVGDTKTFYILRQQNSGASFVTGSVFGFGDFASFSQVDAHRCFCSVTTASVSASTIGGAGGGPLELSDTSTSPSGISAARSRSGVAGAVRLVKALESYNASNSLVVSGSTSNPGGAAFATYPSPTNQGLILSRMVLAEGGGPRGFLRGFYATPQNAHTSFNQMDRVQGQGPFAGRKLMALKCGTPGGTDSQGVVFVDITGPWEN